jgi:hypothetical protein
MLVEQFAKSLGEGELPRGSLVVGVDHGADHPRIV